MIKGRSAYNVLRKAADEIAEGFRAYGCETEVLDTQAEDFLVRLSGCLEQREQYAFCFSLQAIGWEQECTALPQLRDMRRVGWLVDDPFFHEARLIGSVGTGAYVLTVQDAFTQRIREMYPKFEMIETLYHGGFASEQVPRWEDREIDVFFPGSYTSREAVWEKLKKIDGIMGSIAQKVAARLIQNGHIRTWDEELRCYLEEIQFEMSEDEFQTLLRAFYPLDEFQRVCIRERMLEELLKAGRRVSGIPIREEALKIWIFCRRRALTSRKLSAICRIHELCCTISILRRACTNAFLPRCWRELSVLPVSINY